MCCPANKQMTFALSSPSRAWLFLPFLVFLLLLTLLPVKGSATDSIRINGELVSVGDTKLTLLRVMGEPDYQEVITHAVDTGDIPTEKQAPKKKEIWYYFDINGLNYSIHLINSRIRKIEWERSS